MSVTARQIGVPVSIVTDTNMQKLWYMFTCSQETWDAVLDYVCVFLLGAVVGIVFWQALVV